MTDSICWHCANVCTSKCKKPIQGWDAAYKPIAQGGSQPTPSWFVRQCPLYTPDHRAEEWKKDDQLFYKKTRRPIVTTIKCLEHVYSHKVYRFQFWKEAADIIGISPRQFSRYRNNGVEVIQNYRWYEEDPPRKKKKSEDE